MAGALCECDRKLSGVGRRPLHVSPASLLRLRIVPGPPWSSGYAAIIVRPSGNRTVSTWPRYCPGVFSMMTCRLFLLGDVDDR